MCEKVIIEHLRSMLDSVDSLLELDGDNEFVCGWSRVDLRIDRCTVVEVMEFVVEVLSPVLLTIFCSCGRAFVELSKKSVDICFRKGGKDTGGVLVVALVADVSLFLLRFVLLVADRLGLLLRI